MKILALNLIIYTAVTVLSQSVSVAWEKKFPDSLFGVQLGSMHKIVDKNGNVIVGTLPIKKFTGYKTFLGMGFWYHFEPMKEYETFEYIEKRYNPDDEFFATSFSLYVLPVIPKKGKNLETLETYKVYWEVLKINWTKEEVEADKPYYWAYDMCKNVQADLGIEPETIFGRKAYTCSFKRGLKELKIEGLPKVKSFSLAYLSSEFKRKNDEIDTLVRKLTMKESRPY